MCYEICCIPNYPLLVHFDGRQLYSEDAELSAWSVKTVLFSGTKWKACIYEFSLKGHSSIFFISSSEDWMVIIKKER